MRMTCADGDLSPSLQYRRRINRVLFLLAGLLVAVFLLSIGSGAVNVPPHQLLSILVAPFGWELPWGFDDRNQAVILAIRLPRILVGIVVGATLAVCGAALQGLFRNPLADPALIGVSNGAALAAVSVIVLGAESLSQFLPQFLFHTGTAILPLAAFAGGLLATFLVYKIAHHEGSTNAAILLLAGVAFNAIAGAGIGLLIFISTDQQLRDLNFWLLGSLGGMTWETILPALPFIMVTLIGLPFLARHLNALLLGEREAFHLGFDVEKTKFLMISLVALGTGASVAITGVIGFVGLVVPHLVRLMIGPDHRTLLPASILLGASLMLIADLGARMIVIPAELPIGILTSCVGGPFFLWLLLRQGMLMR